MVVLAVPAAPLRCPPAPYERASLIAHYLKAKKPRSKILILDAKDGFSQQKLFEAAWKELYPGMIERIALSQGGRVTSVDAATNTIVTDFGNYTANVASVIPPQKAGRIAEIAGAADNTGWCPIDPVELCLETRAQYPRHRRCLHRRRQFRNRLPPRSAQGKACAAAIVNMMSGKSPEIAPADRRLLQHGRARLCVLAVRHLSTQGRSVRRGRRRDKPGQCAARGAPARGGACRKLVQDNHGGYIWLDRQIRSSAAWFVAALLALPGPAGAQALAALRRRRRRHSGTAHEHARRRGARARAGRRTHPALASSATTAHFPNRSSRAIWPPASPVPAAAGRRASFGFGWSMPRSLNAATIMPSYYRSDGLDARRAVLARQADPVGRTDRGYRGVSGDAA